MSSVRPPIVECATDGGTEHAPGHGPPPRQDEQPDGPRGEPAAEHVAGGEGETERAVRRGSHLLSKEARHLVRATLHFRELHRYLPLPSQSPKTNAPASQVPGRSRIDSVGSLHDLAATVRSCTASRSSCLCCSRFCSSASRCSGLAMRDGLQVTATDRQQ